MKKEYLRKPNARYFRKPSSRKETSKMDYLIATILLIHALLLLKLA